MAEVAPEVLRQLLRYEPETGRLFWLARSLDLCVSRRQMATFNASFAGKEAFTASKNGGYKCGRVCDRSYLAHRVIWAMVHGHWPDKSIDHINGNRADNRIENLRVVTREANQRNCALRKDNKSGEPGVYWNSEKRKWHAQIGLGRGAVKHLGYFNSLDDAVAARNAARPTLGYHENHGRVA